MNDAGLMIVVTEAKAAAEGKETLDEQIEAAMKAAKNHWMVLDEDPQFRGAVGALLLLVDEETRTRIEGELNNLKALSAMISGVPVDIERMEVEENPLGLMKIWKSID